MCPTIKPVEPESRDVIYVPLGVLSASELEAIADLLPELKDESSSRWPITDIHFLKRNPFHLNETETALVIALATATVTKLGEKLGSEAFDWMRHRWKHTAAKNKKKRKRPRR